MTVSTLQMSVLVLATSEGYVNPGSATHARRCNTSTGQLDRACKALSRRDEPLMRPISAGRYQITDAGQALVPHTRRHFDGTEYVEF